MHNIVHDHIKKSIINLIASQCRKHNPQEKRYKKRDAPWATAKDVVDGLDYDDITHWVLLEIGTFLQDPNSVHINTLCGAIAKLTDEQVRHIYPHLFHEGENDYVEETL